MSDCGCGNTLETQAMEARQRRVLLWVLIINLLTFAMMVAGSVLSGSSALLSGTLDNLGDALTYALSFAVVGMGVAAKAKVALVKGGLIAAAAVVVAIHITWRLTHLDAPVVDIMAGAAILNLLANGVCLALLTPHRNADINMLSVWECSRNDVAEGIAVIASAAAVWYFDSGWPDVIAAAALLVLFIRSAQRVLRRAWADYRTSRLVQPV